MTLVDEQRAARHGSFTGRAAELARFREVIAGRAPGRVFIVHGAGGIGKTSLLLEIARLCAAPASRAVYLDAGDHDPRPDVMRAALAAALTPTETRTLVLLDGWDTMTALDGWLRQTVLPQLADRVVLVVAQRDPPDARWRRLAGWGTLIAPIPLEQLSEAESRALLAHLAVPPSRGGDALAFARGHPLALHLVAEALARAPELSLESGSSDVVQMLVNTLLANVASGPQRAALEAAAVVHTMTEPIIAAMLPGEDAAALFRWLAGLSITSATAAGLYLHDLARDVIGADLRWRNPPRWAELVERARQGFAEAWSRVAGSAQQRLVFDLMFLNRHAPWFAGAGTWNDANRPRGELAESADHAALCALVAHHEGEDSAALAAGWLQRQPEAVYAYRDARPAPAGLAIIVALDADAGRGLAWDPGAAAAWRALARLGALRPGETALLARHFMARDGYQLPSPVFIEHMAVFNRLQVTKPGIRFGIYVVADPQFWVPLFKSLDLQPLAEGEFEVGGRTYGMFANDFRKVRPVDYFRRASQRFAGGEPARDPGGAVARLKRVELAAAVRAALKDLHDDERLADNPLVESRLVWVRVEDDDRGARVRALRGLVVAAVESLAASPREHAPYEVMRRTYVDPAPGQKQVAYELRLSWSSYRRALARGVELVVARLWSQELD